MSVAIAMRGDTALDLNLWTSSTSFLETQNDTLTNNIGYAPSAMPDRTFSGHDG